MNYRRFVLAFALSASTSLSAYAAPAVMVQFGSFETMDEAQKRLAEVKAAHGGTLSTLTLGVKEVKLPPDNLTVFRTQAGPVESRATAQSICSKFASSGDECYVVETAMAGKITPATDMAEAVTTPVLSIPSVSLAPITVTTPGMSDIDGAATKTTVIAAMPEASTVTTPVAPKKSFWSRVSPFDTEKQAETPKIEPVHIEKIAPENLALAPETPAIAVDLPATNTSAKVMLPEVSALTTPTLVTPSITTPAISLTPQVYAEAPALPLLPPPPPLTAKDEEFLKRSMPVVAEMKKPEVIAAPVITTPAIEAPTPVAEAPLLPPGKGSVKVEEAKRVPLTENVKAPVVVATPAIIPTPAPQAQPPVSLLPSSTLGQKTLWAQMGQFNTTQEAFAFWEQYRQMHPDFPVVRVRVVSSLMAQMHGNDRVSLNVGPFAREGFIRNLCATVATPTSPVKCAQVTDMGIAGNALPRTGYLNGSRYKR